MLSPAKVGHCIAFAASVLHSMFVCDEAQPKAHQCRVGSQRRPIARDRSAELARRSWHPRLRQLASLNSGSNRVRPSLSPHFLSRTFPD